MWSSFLAPVAQRIPDACWLKPRILIEKHCDQTSGYEIDPFGGAFGNPIRLARGANRVMLIPLVGLLILAGLR